MRMRSHVNKDNNTKMKNSLGSCDAPVPVDMPV
jgi:hypothetical protein